MTNVLTWSPNCYTQYRSCLLKSAYSREVNPGSWGSGSGSGAPGDSGERDRGQGPGFGLGAGCRVRHWG